MDLSLLLFINLTAAAIQGGVLVRRVFMFCDFDCRLCQPESLVSAELRESWPEVKLTDTEHIFTADEQLGDLAV